MRVDEEARVESGVAEAELELESLKPASLTERKTSLLSDAGNPCTSRQRTALARVERQRVGRVAVRRVGTQADRLVHALAKARLVGDGAVRDVGGLEDFIVSCHRRPYDQILP